MRFPQPPSQLSNRTGALYWSIATAALLGSVLILHSLSLDRAGQIVANLFAIVLVPLAVRWPVAAGCSMVALFLLVSAFESLRSPIIVFCAPFLTAAVALIRGPRLSLGFGLVLCYIVVTSPFTGQFLPYDLTGTLVFAIAILAGWLTGTYFQRQTIAYREHQRVLEEDMEQRSERLTRALHDSVATTLTSVVMRAETLGLKSERDPETRRTAELIANEARQAMQEVRQLLRFIRTEEPDIFSETSRNVADQISVTARLLRSHGFNVTGDDEAKRVDAMFPSGIERAFAELATNIIKYAKPGSSVDLSVVADTTSLKCRVINEVRPNELSEHMSSGIGLKETERLVVKQGGIFRSGLQGNTWVTMIQLPVTA